MKILAEVNVHKEQIARIKQYLNISKYKISSVFVSGYWKLYL